VQLSAIEQRAPYTAQVLVAKKRDYVIELKINAVGTDVDA
jgi:hypothetical protein